MCQRAHGAAFVTWIGVDSSQLELKSDASLQWFSSSADAERGFCGVCGSSIFFRSSRWPGEIHVARACVPGAIDREPAAHGFAATAVDWLHLGDDLPRKS